MPFPINSNLLQLCFAGYFFNKPQRLITKTVKILKILRKPHLKLQPLLQLHRVHRRLWLMLDHRLIAVYPHRCIAVYRSIKSDGRVTSMSAIPRHRSDGVLHRRFVHLFGRITCFAEIDLISSHCLASIDGEHQVMLFFITVLPFCLICISDFHGVLLFVIGLIHYDILCIISVVSVSGNQCIVFTSVTLRGFFCFPLIFSMNR
mmetsp:Transcript_15529/g.24506  ORF Transcript_15529/g.24506 Transcript_15529/m.24506 type:complete len:204 (+) Transcript_15529:166-777(+)